MSPKISKIFIVFFIAGALLVSQLSGCSGKKEFLSEKELTLEEKLEQVSAHFRTWVKDEYSDSVVIEGYHLQAYQALYRIYDSVKFQPVWTKDLLLSEKSKTFLNLLKITNRYGLDSGLYYTHDIRVLLDSTTRDKNFVTKAKNLALCDVLLSNAFLLLNIHLEKGFVDSASGKQVWKIDSLKRDVVKELFQFNTTAHVENMLSRQPKNIEYNYLLTALNNYVDSCTLDNRKFAIPELKKDSIGCRDSIKMALIHWQLLDTAFANNDSAQIASFKKFQSIHGLDADGIPGTISVTCARYSSYERFSQACLAVEKWKWKKERSPNIMIRVNIPAFMLHVVRNDSLIRKHRVVTGLPDKQTPEFTAKVRWVTLFPYWNVPHSISTEEILPYVRKGDTSYLVKHEYEMFGFDKNLVNYSKVPWRRLSKDYFPYRLRQKGGPLNALGLIQFHFPNKHDVYLHDTPAKYFFRKNTRSFSHGCIRLQDPFKFGTFLLQQDRKKDTLNIDTVMAWIAKKEEQRIYLKKPIVIEIDYISVTGDSLGNITFHYDIYAKDSKYLKYMKPNPTLIIKKEPEAIPADKKKKQAVIKKSTRKFAQRKVYFSPAKTTRYELLYFLEEPNRYRIL